MTNKSILAAFERMWQHVITNIETNGVSVGDTLPIESQVYFDGTEDEIPEGYVKVDAPFSNPNLLINGGFQVWQRGTSDSNNNSGSPFYVCDRWQAYSNSDSMYISNSRTTDGYMQIQTETTDGTGTCTMRYINEYILPSATYTLSFEASGTRGNIQVYIFDGTSRKQVISNVVDGINTVTFTGTFQSIDFYFNSTTTTTNLILKWVKLEQGSLATPFVPRLYVEELEMCKRYYIIGGFQGVFTYYNSSNGTMVEITTPQMRIPKPTIRINNATYYSTSGVKTVASSGCSAWWRTESPIYVSNVMYVYISEGTRASDCFGATVNLSLDAEIY